MTWSAANAVGKIRREYAGRLAACQQCSERRGNRCRLANQIVSILARTSGATCPIGRWDKPAAVQTKTKPNVATPTKSAPAKPSAMTLETERIARDVTIGASAFRRPGCVERMVKSIRQFYPKTQIIIGDNGDQPANVSDDHLTYLRLPFNIGLSATRNRIVDALQTPYLWLLDDDYEFTAETDCNRFLDVLDADAHIGVVGGALVEDGKPASTWAQGLVLENGVLNGKPVRRDIQLSGHTQYYLSDTANNFALFRREMLADHRWTEPLKLREHADYYWRVKQAGQWQVAVCEQVRCKHLRVQSPEYEEHRHRNHEFLNTMLDLSGLKELNILPGGDPRMAVDGRPNIVVLGVGNSGTTIVTKMLHALGWQAADADETFAESVRLRDINESGDFSGAAEYLAGLPQPWTIKDPRFVRTLGRWQSFLTPYNPLLLWVIRDRESVLESKRKRGVTRESASGQYDSQIRQAGRLYAAWPGPKLWFEYERLEDAVELWRDGNGRLSRNRARENALRFGTERTEEELNRLL